MEIKNKVVDDLVPYAMQLFLNIKKVDAESLKNKFTINDKRADKILKDLENLGYILNGDIKTDEGTLQKDSGISTFDINKGLLALDCLNDSYSMNIDINCNHDCKSCGHHCEDEEFYEKEGDKKMDIEMKKHHACHEEDCDCDDCYEDCECDDCDCEDDCDCQSDESLMLYEISNKLDEIIKLLKNKK